MIPFRWPKLVYIIRNWWVAQREMVAWYNDAWWLYQINPRVFYDKALTIEANCIVYSDHFCGWKNAKAHADKHW